MQSDSARCGLLCWDVCTCQEESRAISELVSPGEQCSVKNQPARGGRCRCQVWWRRRLRLDSREKCCQEHLSVSSRKITVELCAFGKPPRRLLACVKRAVLQDFKPTQLLTGFTAQSQSINEDTAVNCCFTQSWGQRPALCLFSSRLCLFIPPRWQFQERNTRRHSLPDQTMWNDLILGLCDPVLHDWQTSSTPTLCLTGDSVDLVVLWVSALKRRRIPKERVVAREKPPGNSGCGAGWCVFSTFKLDTVQRFPTSHRLLPCCTARAIQSLFWARTQYRLCNS